MKINSNVMDVIKNLNVMQKAIIVSNKDSVRKLAEIGYSTAKSNVIPFKYEPEVAQNIVNGIKLEIIEGTDFTRATITATDENSIFYEYGTGIIGKSNSHPEASNAGWVYNLPTPFKRISSVTGNEGWFHTFETGSRFTSGQPASAFMFKAYTQILKNTVTLSKEELRKAIRSVGSR